MNTVKQTAGKLGVSEKTVRGLISAGLIEHHRIGVRRGRIRVSDQAIAQYLASTKVEAQAERTRSTPRPHRLKHLKL